MGVTPVRWGIIGTGNINTKILAGGRQTPAVDFVAVASRDPDRATTYAAEHGIPVGHGSYEALLADESVEAVYISLPNALHHLWTMRSLAAGKHVICEKPYSTSPDEVVAAFDLADEHGLVLSEGFMWRHSPQTARMMGLLPSVGRIETVRATFSFPLTWDVDIRLMADLAGGSLMDVGCYCVSACRLVAGEEPERVYGEAVMGPSGVDLRFTGVLRFPSGIIAEFTSAFTTSHMSLEVIGRDGSITLRDPWHATAPVVHHGEQETRLPFVDPYREEFENVSLAIRGAAGLRLGRADALGQARTIAALYRSAAAGTSVAP